MTPRGIKNIPRTIEWVAPAGSRPFVRIVDQRLLPQTCKMCAVSTADALIEAIEELALRGAPALGVAGAMALCLWAENESNHTRPQPFLEALESMAQRVATARPTAVNLSWGVEQVMEVARCRVAAGDTIECVKEALVARACEMAQEDEAANRAIGAHGAKLLAPGCRVLTHCNAGSLATVYYGTALGVVYAAHEQGKIERVYADETRPVNQGARLTMWELTQAGVPCTLQCDSMAASLMAAGKIDVVIVGADRICANGDAANKIGTYPLAIAATYHHLPFYVAAPFSTIDHALARGAEIPIEHRAASEVCDADALPVAVYNPAFDVTPAALITAFITERGVLR
ncbi:MAG: S-methyl-5-thioribose-1-phosphate isomerase, partial [Raoultibacter sp.]